MTELTDKTMTEWIDKTMTELLQEGLATSAELLGSFYPEPIRNSISANSLFELGEYSRALKLYQATLQAIDSTNPKTEMLLKQKCAECHLKLRDQKSAFTTYRSVPLASLTTSNLLKMGYLTRDFEGKKRAQEYFVALVQRCPFALEAILELIDMGASMEELQTWTNGNITKVPWVMATLLAHQNLAKHNYKNAIAQFTDLTQKYQIPHLLKSLALAYYRNMDLSRASQVFEKIRRIDENYVDSMDIYAICLFVREGNIAELNRLAHGLMVANPNRAETWTAVAIYSHAKGRDTAMSHIDRALSLNHRNAPSYFFKGWLQLFNNDVNEATKSYSKARALQTDLPTFKAMVDCYIKSQNLQPALRVARETQKAMPTHPTAICLPAIVYVQTTDPKHHDTAKSILTDVMKKHPDCTEAVIGLARLYSKQQKPEDGIKLIKETLERISTPLLQCTIADLICETNEEGAFDLAIIHYNNALALNPLYEPAIVGLENVERKINGPGSPDYDEVSGDDPV